MIEVKPRNGIFVASISIDEADDIYRIRAALEGVAARLVAERISERDLKRLRAFAESAGEPRLRKQSRNNHAIVEQAENFHSCIHEYANSPQLVQLLELIYARVSHYRNVTLSLPGRAETASHGHLEIYEAIARRDGSAAEALMREHVEGARISLMGLLSQIESPEAKRSSQASGDGA